MSKLAKVQKDIEKNREADLLKMLHDKDKAVRLAVIEGLGKIGKDAACNTLITEIDDEDPEIRAAVATALGEIGDEHTATHLSYRNSRETEEKVLRAIHEALGKIKARGR